MRKFYAFQKFPVAFEFAIKASVPFITLDVS